MKKFKKIFLLLFILLSSNFLLFSNDTIILESNFQKIQLLRYIYILEDSSSNMDINKVINSKSLFKKNEAKSLNFGYNLNVFWLKFSLYNYTDTIYNLILSIENPDLNHIELHQMINGHLQKVVTGERYDINTRDISHGSFLFKISLNRYERRDCYIKVDSEGEANYIPIKLQNENLFFTYNERNNAIRWMVYGLLFFVVVFNLYLYKSIKDKIYLQYALYVFFGLLFFMVYDGYLAYLNIPLFILKTKIFVIALWVYFLLNFSQIFLETATKAKKVNLLFNILKISSISFAVLFFFNYPIFVISLIGLSLIFVIAFISVIIGAIRLYNRNYLPSLFFLISFFPSLLGVIAIQLKETGIVPANVFFESALRFGVMIETVLLTIAILERFRIQQNEAKSLIEHNYSQIRTQKRELEKVNIELEKLSIVARETDNSVSIYDSELNIEWCNDAFEILHEISFQNFIKKNKHNVLDIYNIKKELIENCINRKISLFTENQSFTESGREVWMQTTLSPYFDKNGNLLKLIAIDSDITKIKKYQVELTQAKEKAEESDRLKSSFLSNMSHEIRTPLNAILGFSEMLKDNRSERQKEKYITLIRSNGLHLLRIIGDIIDISKIESGQMIAHNTKESVDKILSELYEYYVIDKTLLSKELKLKLHKSEHNELIYCDHSKVHQILDNLLNNAVKFTNEGTIEFGANVEEEKITYFVKDTGIGFSEENKEHIFERFWQSESGLSRKYGGTGLGLSISKGLIVSTNGKIWVESEPGKGSSFFFEVPYKKIVERPSENKNVNQFNIINKKILIVEDIEDSALLISEMLDGSGALLFFAQNGKEAYKMAMENDFDLILMDLRLPDINGFDVTMSIFEKKEYATVIAQTANTSDNERQRCLNNGFAGYITKPIDRTELFNTLASINL